jgi:uncharacterized surface protein with fasciclin (FAS1) repeats
MQDTHHNKENTMHRKSTEKSTKALTLLAGSFLAAVLAVPPAGAHESTVMVGGQPMYPSKDIVDNAVNSADHKTLVAAVKAAGLVDTLKGKGPYTVFAPTDSAFARLPSGTVDGLLKPESRNALTKLLTYHVVPGRYDFAALQREIVKQGGKARLTTASGGTLNFTMNGTRNIQLMDESGHSANISTYDVAQSNGVINVIDTVLMPQ